MLICNICIYIHTAIKSHNKYTNFHVIRNKYRKYKYRRLQLIWINYYNIRSRLSSVEYYCSLFYIPFGIFDVITYTQEKSIYKLWHTTWHLSVQWFYVWTVVWLSSLSIYNRNQLKDRINLKVKNVTVSISEFLNYFFFCQQTNKNKTKYSQKTSLV